MNITLHILFIGIAFFQMLFMSIQWAVFKRREYVFYIAYIFCVSLYTLLRVHAATGVLNVSLHFWISELLDQPLAILSYWMYICFSRSFLNLKKTQPVVYRYSRLVEIVFIVFIIVKCITIPFDLAHKTTVYIYLFSSLLMVLPAVPMIVLMLKQKNILNNFLVIGSLCYVAGGVTGMLMGVFLPNMGRNNINVLYGIEIGVLMELLLLNTGFMLKNKLLQQQVIKGQQKIMQQMLGNKDFFKGND